MSLNRTSQPRSRAAAAMLLALLVGGCSGRDTDMAEKVARAEAAANRAESAALRAEAAAKRVQGTTDSAISDEPEPQDPPEEINPPDDPPENPNPVG